MYSCVPNASTSPLRPRKERSQIIWLQKRRQRQSSTSGIRRPDQTDPLFQLAVIPEALELDGEDIAVQREYANIGAGIGGGYGNTTELKPMKIDEALNGPDAERWRAEIDNEHNRMVHNQVFEAVEKADMPPGATAIDSSWVMKKKSNGTLRGRFTARGFKQREGEHYDSSSISAPVTCAATIRIVIVLMLMAG